MNITNEFLKESERLYHIVNGEKFYKKLTWVVSFENKMSVSNKICDDSKISNVILDEKYFLKVYGSEKSDGINNFAQVLYYGFRSDKKIQKNPLLDVFVRIVASPHTYFFNWNPIVNNSEKLYIEIYE